MKDIQIVSETKIAKDYIKVLLNLTKSEQGLVASIKQTHIHVRNRTRMPDDDSDYPQKQTPSTAVVVKPVDWRSQQGDLAQAFFHFFTARHPVLLPCRLRKAD